MAYLMSWDVAYILPHVDATGAYAQTHVVFHPDLDSIVKPIADDPITVYIVT